MASGRGGCLIATDGALLGGAVPSAVRAGQGLAIVNTAKAMRPVAREMPASARALAGLARSDLVIRVLGIIVLGFVM